MAQVEGKKPSADMLGLRCERQPRAIARNRGFGVRSGPHCQAFDRGRLQGFRIHDQLPDISRASIGTLEIDRLAGRGPSEGKVNRPLSPDIAYGDLFEL